MAKRIEYDLPADEHLLLLACFGGKHINAAAEQQAMPSRRRQEVWEKWAAAGWCIGGWLTPLGIGEAAERAYKRLTVNPATVAG